MFDHSTDNRPHGVDRRGMLRGLMFIPFLSAVSLAACSSPRSNLHEYWRDFLSDVANQLIPQTDTPSADAVYVWAQDMTLRGIYVKLDGLSMEMLDTLEAALNAACAGDYRGASEQQRYRALEQLDARCFATIAAGDKSPEQGNIPADLITAWKKIKGMILLGFYTSEAGASQELRYELAPGRYDPDVKVEADTYAISSDWLAVSFR